MYYSRLSRDISGDIACDSESTIYHVRSQTNHHHHLSPSLRASVARGIAHLTCRLLHRDILQYIVLDKAIKYGDVGLMEACLPQLLLRFIGGKNSNYANEVLELLQCLEREWPAEIK